MRPCRCFHHRRDDRSCVGRDRPVLRLLLDTWQLIINTGTTVITFLMVFLIQNTQNRDTAAIQLKLDELIRANQDARNNMLCLEDLSEDELKRVKSTFAALASSPEKAIGAVHDMKEELEETENVLQEANSRLVMAGHRDG